MREIPFAARDNAFRRLEQVASEAALTPTERLQYEKDLKQYRYIMNVERSRFAEGKREGIAIGEANIIIKMLKSGMDVASIAAITGESEEWIASLR